MPLVIVAGVLAIITGFALYRTQRWLARRTHRVFNYGLLTASVALIISVVWLLATFAVARSDLARHRHPARSFRRDISGAISSDLGTFQSSATAGAGAFGPLEDVVIAAALLMAGGCAWGLGRRLGEYR